jgi:hypothetical protein
MTFSRFLGAIVVALTLMSAPACQSMNDGGNSSGQSGNGGSY